jgi:hypothetical protein
MYIPYTRKLKRSEIYIDIDIYHQRTALLCPFLSSIDQLINPLPNPIPSLPSLPSSSKKVKSPTSKQSKQSKDEETNKSSIHEKNLSIMFCCQKTIELSSFPQSKLGFLYLSFILSSSPQQQR